MFLIIKRRKFQGIDSDENFNFFLGINATVKNPWSRKQNSILGGVLILYLEWSFHFSRNYAEECKGSISCAKEIGRIISALKRCCTFLPRMLNSTAVPTVCRHIG